MSDVGNLQISKSVDLEEILLRLSENSDFKISQFPSRSLSKIEDLQRALVLEPLPPLPKTLFPGKINFNKMIWPFLPELVACLMGYLALLSFSLLKGGKGFQR